MSTDNSQTSGLSAARERVGVLVVVVAAVLALGLTALFLVIPVRVEQPAYSGIHSTLGDMRYGWPYEWLSQDQRAMDPPAGNSRSFCDIRECPTGILLPGLAGNILLLWIGLAILAVAIAVLARTIRSERKFSSAPTAE